eukprot:gene23868-23923_t
MFLRVLFTRQVGALFKGNRGPLVSPKVSQFLTLPRTQRYIIIGLIVAAIPKPTFFGLSFDRSAAEGMQTFHEYFGIAYNPVSKVVF